MFKIRYVLFGNVRYYEKYVETNVIPEKGTIVKFRLSDVSARIEKIVFYVETEEQQPPFYEIFLTHLGSITYLKHQMILSSGWRSITEDQTNYDKLVLF